MKKNRKTKGNICTRCGTAVSILWNIREGLYCPICAQIEVAEWNNYCEQPLQAPKEE